jgi:hypothetical protein
MLCRAELAGACFAMMGYSILHRLGKSLSEASGTFAPLIELEPTDHPLALEQRSGISVDRVAEIYAIMMHGRDQ